MVSSCRSSLILGYTTEVRKGEAPACSFNQQGRKVNVQDRRLVRVRGQSPSSDWSPPGWTLPSDWEVPEVGRCPSAV